MTITQTVNIPADHRLIIDVPREVPVGPVVLVFKPVGKELVDPGPHPTEEEEIELINRNAEWLNEEAEDVLLDQDLDAFEEDLKRATPEMLTLLHDTTVTFSMADCVAERPAKESSGA